MVTQGQVLSWKDKAPTKRKVNNKEKLHKRNEPQRQTGTNLSKYFTTLSFSIFLGFEFMKQSNSQNLRRHTRSNATLEKGSLKKTARLTKI